MRTSNTVAVVAVVLLAASCGSSEEEQSPFLQTVLAHEQLIADCMEEQGFDYHVAVPSDALIEDARIRAELAEADVEEAVAAVDVPPDVNGEYRAQLSDPEQLEYDRAFYGPEGDPQAGCFRQTYVEAWGADPLTDEFAAEDEAAQARIDQDPDVIAAGTDYLSCMAEQGYDVGDFDDIFVLTDPEVGTLQGAAADVAHEQHDACYAPVQDARDAAYLREYDID